MVAGSSAASPSAAAKCRYKTGKCTNTRSSKRNGQPHQLCLYHREKANKIQRKFDRQKRQIARVRKSQAQPKASTSVSVSAVAASPSSLGSPSASSLFAFTSSAFGADPLASPSAASTASSSSFTTLAAHDVELYSDSDSSRFSTDSDSSLVLEQVWQDLPQSALDVIDAPLAAAFAAPNPMGCSQSYLSSDELDFLCSAILE